MYKYSCRECPIRDRCIDQSDTAARVKTMIRNAFAARTDTLSTWGILQKKCLLLQADEERERRANQESLLSRRLREAKERTTGQLSSEPVEAQPEEPEPVAPSRSPTPFQRSSFDQRERPSESIDTIGAEELHQPGEPDPDPAQTFPSTHPVTGPFDRRLQDSLPDRQMARQLPDPYWFTVMGSNRHIALPDTGQLLLGRFDPDLEELPDVDLTYEDQIYLTVSRRHARVVGVNGRYTVKDLDSSNGLYLNGERVTLGLSRQLRPGDHIALGQLQLLFEDVPAEYLDPTRLARFRHYLLVCFTGRKHVLTPSKRMIMGRSRRSVNATPDIDLRKEGEVAFSVADQHAAFSWQDNALYLEDLGSGAETRLNGELLTPQEAVPLRPGDHIRLGGCVLAYDVRKG